MLLSFWVTWGLSLERKSTIKLVIILVATFVIGCVIGYVFKDSKTVIRKEEVSNEKDTKLIEDLKRQVNSLTHQNKKLAEKTHTIIIEKADGSKRTEIKTESELYETRTKEVKEKYEKQLAEAQKEIFKLKEKEKIEINKKRFGIEFGVLASKSYYVHINADVFGPLYIGVQTQLGNNNTLGAGVGLRL
jgi:uncharacterized membrane protein YhiD involved in acid resistance